TCHDRSLHPAPQNLHPGKQGHRRKLWQPSSSGGMMGNSTAGQSPTRPAAEAREYSLVPAESAVIAAAPPGRCLQRPQRPPQGERTPDPEYSTACGSTERCQPDSYRNSHQLLLPSKPEIISGTEV